MVGVPPAPTGVDLPDDAALTLTASARPALPSGGYTVTATHLLDGAAVGTATSLQLHVAGPRFVLPAAEIHAVYPPAGATGEFDTVLPHVVLERQTLPWERQADPDEPEDSAVPWLAVLVLRPEEIVAEATVAPAELIGPTVPAEPGDLTGDPVRTLEISAELARAILPTPAELALLTHVRRVELAGEVSSACAVVTAGRLPQADSVNVAHLVSLEGRYLAGVPRVEGRTVRLVSLLRWEFTAQPARSHEFDELAMKLLLGHPSLPVPPGTPPPVAAQLTGGAVPVEHRLDDGTRTAAWYRGPFLPGTSPAAGLDLLSTVRHSRDLLLMDAATGMVDLSYAAAWELGRLLVLQEPTVAASLHAWRRGTAHAERIREQLDARPHTGVQDPTPPAWTLDDWFEARLTLLGGVPFGYLVPDPELLPPGSVRPFRLDPVWLECLRDGALSIGRTRGRQPRTVEPPLRQPSPVSGLLMRSPLVQDFPGLIVEAYSGRSREAAKVTPMRVERLAPDVLLALFDGPVELIDLHQHPQVLHAGVDRRGDDLVKRRAGRTDVDVEYRGQASGVVQVEELARQLLAGPGPQTSFAWEMIEAVPRISLHVARDGETS